MVGRLWEARRPWRIVSPSLTVSALVLGACDQATPGTVGVDASGGLGSGASSGFGTGTAGAGGSRITFGGAAGSIIISNEGGSACKALLGMNAPLFADQAFDQKAPVQRELYSWTTPEQLAEIREQGRLLTRTEREGLGPGYAVERLTQFASTAAGTQAELAKLLTSEAFARARYAWPRPWATRMGWPGETYGGELLRMVLRAEARIVVYAGGSLTVYGADQQTVLLEEALAEPERIAGFFFLKDANLGGPICGSFISGGNTYREFIIGNEAMIEEYSFHTATILERLQDDIALLEQFFEHVRPCPETRSPTEWNLSFGCGWPGLHQVEEQSAYEAALAMPSPGYFPASAPLAALIDTLKADLFTPDPLIVRPGE